MNFPTFTDSPEESVLIHEDEEDHIDLEVPIVESSYIPHQASNYQSTQLPATTVSENIYFNIRPKTEAEADIDEKDGFQDQTVFFPELDPYDQHLCPESPRELRIKRAVSQPALYIKRNKLNNLKQTPKPFFPPAPSQTSLDDNSIEEVQLTESYISHVECRPIFDEPNTYFSPPEKIEIRPLFSIQKKNVITLDPPVAHVDMKKPKIQKQKDYKAQFVGFKFQKSTTSSQLDPDLPISAMVQQMMREIEIQERSLEYDNARFRTTSASGWIANADMDLRHRDGTADRVRYILEQASLQNVHATFRKW